jgi:hypothetical protein
MRRFLYILTLIIFAYGCTNRNKEKSVNMDYHKDSTISKNNLFLEWLNKYELSTSDFQDSSVRFGYSFWGFTDSLKTSDSNYYWYPSIDSSYFLITNINTEKERNVHKTGEGIRFSFFNTQSKKVHLGIEYLNLDSLDSEILVDIFWANEHIIYILEKSDNADFYSLMKLNMHVDSIWKYKTKKITKTQQNP